MRTSRIQLAVATVLSILLGVATYVAITVGQAQLLSSPKERADDAGAVPEQVYNAPDTVPTTSEHGPVGAVSMVFAGTDVLTGLTGHLAHPWIAISSRTGAYRALDAPHLPDAGAGEVAVSSEGRQLAWSWQDGVVVYDAVEDVAREMTDGIGASPRVGGFSSDGAHLLVHDGAMHVLDVTTGDVVASADGVAADAARNATWTPDGSAVTFLTGDRLVSFEWRSQRRTSAPLHASVESTLAWQPSGDRLAVMHEVGRGVNVVSMFDVDDRGGFTPSGTIRPEQRSLERLLGFTSDTHLSVVGLSMETGALEQVYRLSAADSTVTPVMRLASAGSNWRGFETVSFAARPLAAGSVDYDEPRWPWSTSAKLVASVLVSVFVLGLYLTRGLPKQMRRA